MSFAKSFYADQKKIEPKQPMSPASMPATTPVAEDPLSAAQIQEAIRLYRSVLSSSQSAPSSPRRGHQEEVERRAVHSNYYGGGPTDIPQSYLLNYSPSVAPAPAPAPAPQVAREAPPTFEEAPQFSEQQLIAQLENLRMEQKEETVTVVPKKTPMLQKMYDDEESGYCFNWKKEEEAELQEEATPTIPVAQETVHYSQPVMVPVQKAYVPSGPSEYIGMSNDNRFIYDAQKALPVSYTLVNSSPAPPAPKLNLDTDVGMTTEDITQVPESPAITSRFRGMIRNAQTPVTAPIVVERVAEASPTGYHYNHYNQQNNNNYGAFMPLNHNSMESEYQLPVLNDLASCIEHY